MRTSRAELIAQRNNAKRREDEYAECLQKQGENLAAAQAKILELVNEMSRDKQALAVLATYHKSKTIDKAVWESFGYTTATTALPDESGLVYIEVAGSLPNEYRGGWKASGIITPPAEKPVIESPARINFSNPETQQWDTMTHEAITRRDKESNCKTGKKQHDSKTAADGFTALLTMKHGPSPTPLTSYECNLCQAWHIGRKTEHKQGKLI